MTDSSGGDDSNWWGGWLDSAIQKSAAAYELVRKDLAEFSSTVQQDTSNVTASLKQKLSQENTASASDKLKTGVNSLLDGISKALSVEPGDPKPHTSSTSCHAAPIIFDRSQARLHALQIDPGTYTTPPPNPTDDFDKWVMTFSLEAHKGDISELLVSQVEMRKLYTHLVPSTVSHGVFWQRYFYRHDQLKREEEMRAALMERAHDTTDKDDIDWDDEEEISCTSSDRESPTSPSVAVDLTNTASSTSTIVATETDSRPTEEPASLEVESTIDEVMETKPTKEEAINKDIIDVPVETALDTMTITADDAISQDPSSTDDVLSPLEMVPEDSALKMRLKGDLVLVGAGSSDSASLSIESLASKELTDEDWEDFDEDVVTDEPLTSYDPTVSSDTIVASTIARTDVVKHTAANKTKEEDDDDWENWD